MTIRMHAYVSYVIPVGKSLETCLFKLGRNCWIISPSMILCLWNVCAEERTRQVKECDAFSHRCFQLFAIIRVKNNHLHACISILCNSCWEKFGNIITCLFKLGWNCRIISSSLILRLWNVCAEERTRQVKEYDAFSRRCFAGSEV